MVQQQMSLNRDRIVQVILRERIEILGYINSFLSDSHLAEDCFQEVCAAAISRSEPFEDESNAIRWTMSAARFKAIDLARKRSRQPILLDDDVLVLLEQQWTDDVSRHPSEANVQSIVLRECLKCLTDNNRRIIELRYFDGLTSARIAELLGRNVESVYRAITRIHTSLRDCLKTGLARENQGATS